MRSGHDTFQLTVTGMHCAGCALGIEKTLRERGAEEVSVDFASGIAFFKLSTPSTLPSIVESIKSRGFSVTTQGEEIQPEPGLPLESKVAISAALTLPLALHMFLPWAPLHNPYVQLLLSIPVVGIGLFHFGRSAFNSLKIGIPNMDVLIFVGIISAFGYSLAGTLLNLGEDFLFYETAATISTFVLIGNLLEHRAVRKTTSAVESLTKLRPSRARRIESVDGSEKIVEIESQEIRREDILALNTGDKAPVDGVITWGEASIDEGMVSGESTPVVKKVGDTVIGGTVLVSGSVRFQATAIGEETVLAHIIRMVQQAQARKPDIQRLADRVSAVFVPAVMLISLFTFILAFHFLEVPFQGSLLRAIAVLVISCPCAMGLATPTAVIVGLGRAAQNGILLKGGDIFEKLSAVKMFVFDKTGTLTTGDFVVRGVTQREGFSEKEIKSAIKGLELHSSHPIARSIVTSFADVTPIEFKDVKEEPGFGIRGTAVDGVKYAFGSPSQISEKDHDGSDLYLLRNGRPIGGLQIRDEARPDAKGVITALHKQNFRTYLLSGDALHKCLSLADEIGIEEVSSGRTPEQKMEIIESLELDEPIAFIGDGINDAPALARAHVGISLSEATDVAVQSAQVILLQGNLGALPKAVKISQLTLATIKQNLFWAFFYNVCAIPLAATGALSPMVAALAMGFSDVIVIGNSLRLKVRNIDN